MAKYKGTTGLITEPIAPTYHKLPSVTTTKRDALTAAVGMLVYNSTLGLVQQNNADGWASIASPPIYASINITNLEESDSTQTLVITGSNFDSGATGKLLDNNGLSKVPTTSTRNSSTQITIVYSGGDLLAETVPQPLDVVVTNISGLGVTGENVLTIDARPVWVTAAGALTDQTYVEDVAITSVNLVATDVENTPTYTISSGALPSGLALSSAGALTGTPNVSDTYNSSGVTHNFDVRANDTTGNTTDRSFSIVRYWADGASAGRAAVNANAIKTLISGDNNDDGIFWIKPSGLSAVQVYCEFNSYGGWMLFAQGDGSSTPIPSGTGASGNVTTLLGGTKGKHADATFNAITWNYCWVGMTDNDDDSTGSGSGRNTMDNNRQNFTRSGTQFTINWVNYSSLTSGTTTNGRNQAWSYLARGGQAGAYMIGSARQPSGDIVAGSPGANDQSVGNSNVYYIGSHDGGDGGIWVHAAQGESGSFSNGFGGDYNNVNFTDRYTYWFLS